MEKYVNERKYHYLYKITNLVNNKYYYGIHSTDNLEDGKEKEQQKQIQSN